MRGNIRTLLTLPLYSTHGEKAAIGENKVDRPQGGDLSPAESCKSAALSAMAEGAQETCRLSRVRVDVGGATQVERTENKNKNIDRPLKSTRSTSPRCTGRTATGGGQCTLQKSRLASDSQIPMRKPLGEGVCGEER